jgi:hypothetical protein
MPKSIDEFRTNFKPVHGNRFKIIGDIPNEDFKSELFEFYVKATQLPGSSIGIVPMNYRGRKINVPAERGFSDWAITFYSSHDNQNDFRFLFENWLNGINSGWHTNMNYTLTSNWEVSYGDTDNINFNKKFYLINCFPSDISTIEISNDVSDTFMEFTVSMTYDYYIAQPIGNQSSSPRRIQNSSLPPSDFRI